MNQTAALGSSVFRVVLIVGLFWCVKSFEIMTQIDLSGLGILPHSQQGLLGIITGPIVHGSFDHLMTNTLPLLVLGSLLFYGYPHVRWRVVGTIWLISGLGVWLFGRHSVHLGASGLTHGFFFFLVLTSILRRDKLSVVIMFIAFFLFGGMIWSIFPSKADVSFEYHFFGAVAGVLAALRWHKIDPKPEEPRYEWENSGAEQDDPVIGDEWSLDRDRDRRPD